MWLDEKSFWNEYENPPQTVLEFNETISKRIFCFRIFPIDMI